MISIRGGDEREEQSQEHVLPQTDDHLKKPVAVLELPIRHFAFGSARCSEFEDDRVVNGRSKPSSSLAVRMSQGRIARAGNTWLQLLDESELVVADTVFWRRHIYTRIRVSSESPGAPARSNVHRAYRSVRIPSLSLGFRDRSSQRIAAHRVSRIVRNPYPHGNGHTPPSVWDLPAALVAFLSAVLDGLE